MSVVIIIGIVATVIVAILAIILSVVAFVLIGLAALLAGAGGSWSARLAGLRVLWRILPRIPAVLPLLAKSACRAASALDLAAAALTAVQSAGQLLKNADTSVPKIRVRNPRSFSLWDALPTVPRLPDHPDASVIDGFDPDHQVVSGLGPDVVGAGEELRVLAEVDVHDLTEIAGVFRALSEAIDPGSCPDP